MTYRHGDVQLVAVDAIPQNAKPKEGTILAHGEKTGHAHRMDIGELFETRDGKLYLKLKKPGKLDHEEHKKSPIPTGVYFVCQKRQYANGAWERVQD